ncbi:MAG: toll/interleukin-1 receptor domain-containing protein [Pseudonocardiaceae bacterium]
MSYSHSADELLAPVLQRLIRRVGQQWYRRSKLRVFRDQSNLPMSASLWGSIEAALERSTYFVLMASSTAADSPWVTREVEYWRRNRERENFFIVLTSGTIEWDTHRCDFDWDGPSALPDVMSGWFLEEPSWIDLRLPAKDGVHPNQRNDRLRDAARTIAASLHGIDKDQLDGDDERESRRARRTLRGGIVALSVLLVLALAGAGVAIVQLRMAQELQRLATARQLVAQADAARGADPRTALLLGIAAQRIHPDEQTASSLVDTLTASRFAGTLAGNPGRGGVLAFAPGGRLLAAGMGDRGRVALWDVAEPGSARRVGPVLSPSDDSKLSYVELVAFSPDGHTLAVVSLNFLILWDVTDPAQPHLLGGPVWITSELGVVALAFTPDGHGLAAGTSVAVTLFDVTQPAEPRQLGPPLAGPGGQLVFSSDGRTLAGARTTGSGGDETFLMMWDVSNPAQPLPRGQPLTGVPLVSSIALSPDLRILATGNFDGETFLWDLTDPAQPRRLQQPLAGLAGIANFAAFGAGGRTLVTGAQTGEVLVWDVTNPWRSHRIEPPLLGHRDPLRSITLSPDGHTVATGDAAGTVLLWNIADPAQPQPIGVAALEHSGHARSVAVSAERNLLVVARTDGTAVLWDVSDPARPRSIGSPLTGLPEIVPRIALAANGLLAIDGSATLQPDQVILWDINNSAAPRRVGRPVEYGRAVALATGGGLLATNDRDRLAIVLWDLADPAAPRPIGPPLAFNSSAEPEGLDELALSPDGHLLAAASTRGSVLLWDLTDPALPRLLERPLTSYLGRNSSGGGLAFAPDGRTLAVGSTGGSVVLWDITDPAAPSRLGQPLTGDGDATSMAFSADGRTLATGHKGSSYDGEAVLWDLTDRPAPRRLGQPLRGQFDDVHALAFLPGDRTLATATSDGTVLWDLSGLADLREHATQRACARTGRGLDRDEWTRYITGLAYEDTCAN